MKYLKTFESIGESYKEITDEEFGLHLYGDGEVSDEEFIQNNWRMFSDREEREIKDMFIDFKGINSGYTIVASIYLTYDAELTPSQIYITKTRDEWFYVEFQLRGSVRWQSKFYQCDQFDGLLDCLRYLNNYEMK